MASGNDMADEESVSVVQLAEPVPMGKMALVVPEDEPEPEEPEVEDGAALAAALDEAAASIVLLAGTSAIVVENADELSTETGVLDGAETAS